MGNVLNKNNKWEFKEQLRTVSNLFSKLTSGIKNMGMQLITENLQSKEGTFYFELNEKANFDKGLYNEFIYSIIDSFVSIEDKDERHKLSLEMWELFFVISKNFISHQNKFDLYKINGIE